MFFLYIARTFTLHMPQKKATKSLKAKDKPVPQKSGITKQKTSSTIVSKPVIAQKPAKPEPKNKLVLEYIINASQKLLYEFITSSSGLSEWFADDVNIQGNIYTFIWDGSRQQAEVLNITEGRSIRLRWTDRPSDAYFEFRIEQNELTHELSLVITDFAEAAEEKNSLEVLWQGQVQRLMKIIGSKA